MNEQQQYLDLSGIIPALKFATEELIQQQDRVRPATREELTGMVLMLRSRGYVARFE